MSLPTLVEPHALVELTVGLGQADRSQGLGVRLGRGAAANQRWRDGAEWSYMHARGAVERFSHTEIMAGQVTGYHQHNHDDENIKQSFTGS